MLLFSARLEVLLYDCVQVIGLIQEMETDLKLEHNLNNENCMQKKTYSLSVAGKTLTAEFNDIADQSSGSVMLRYGNTTVFCTAVMSHKPGSSSFFPLTVDYEEKFYASGKILGSRFMRREGKPSDEAILSGRVIDRTIRPLFKQHIRHDIQVVVTVLSIDEDDPDVLGVIGASLALGTSQIPWNGPVSAVRIGSHNGGENFEINPTYRYRDDNNATLDLLACGKDGNINMIEIGGQEVSEDILMKGLTQSSEEIEKIQAWQKEIIKEIGKEKVDIPEPEIPKELVVLFDEDIAPRFKDAIYIKRPGKSHINDLKEEWLLLVENRLPDTDPHIAGEYFEEQVDALLHRETIENEERPDGRKLDEVRPLFAQAGGISDMLHGSGLFYRGGTHVLSALTLGGPEEAQVLDSMESQDTKKRFMHHYNFPPFSVGETGRLGGVNRRATGHGALAEKALSAVIPSENDFPYTIRLVSECMASNGSTSMGSVCASTLALMDGGVPIKRPVAGIASGLMLSGVQSAEGGVEYRYKILTDIQGPEDHHGDMDFKVAGTEQGVTAVQMDVKVDGIPLAILEEAFIAARKARLYILDTIQAEIKEPRKELSPRAPHISIISIKPDQIGMVIGSGGKTINSIKDETGADITIEDDGTVYISGSKEGVARAKERIEAMTHEFTVGEKFTGKVIKITDFGAFVKINEYTEGLVHISEIAPRRIDRVESVISVGDMVPVIIKGIDEKDRIKLSIKDSDPHFFDSHNGTTRDTTK